MADEHRKLLHQLKTTAEGLLISQVSNVWQVYGGLNRLHNVVHQIFSYKCKILTHEGKPDCWTFIQGLRWLHPPLAASPTFISDTNNTQGKTSAWLYKSLESHTLSHKLSWLLSDQQHLSSCYESCALLCQPLYSEAVLICLRAVEHNQLSLLTDIDPALYLLKWKNHRRCSSFPDVIMPRAGKTESKLPPLDTEMSPITASPVHARRVSLNKAPTRPVLAHQSTWKSLPNLSDLVDSVKGNIKPTSAPVLRRPCTLPSSPAIHPTRSAPNVQKNKSVFLHMLNIDYKQLQKDTSIPKSILKNSNKNNKNSSNELIVLKEVIKSEPIVINNRAQKHSNPNESTTSSNGSSDNVENKSRNHKCINEISNSIYEETDSSCMDSLSLKSFQRSVRIRSTGVRFGIKSSKRKSFMESGGNSVQPMSTGFFPRPTQGQSLSSFLSSGQFAGAKAELDRENAHFAISEAMISAIEQVKYNMWTKTAEETIEESDEEINQLKQRIRLRRRQKQEEKRLTVHGLSLLSDGKTDTTTTESVSPLSSSPGGSSDSFSTDGVHDIEIDDLNSTNLNELADSGLSLSLASLFSAAELSHVPSLPPGLVWSAEGVALSLLRRFSDKQLPRASDVQWLVSEHDAGGQRLLPLPTSWPVSPDEGEDMRQATPLRGTIEWAPPRPQIIFNTHSSPNRQELMTKQNYRCAGCGMLVARQYASKFRYCEYLGRYFCTGCHTNQMSLIPGRIIQKWDFTRCVVSNFSYRLLDQMSGDPLFNINDLNPGLYKKVRALDKIRVYRIQLHYLKDFLNTCRFVRKQETKLQDFLKSVPPYFLLEPHLYSIQDLFKVKQGCMIDQLKLMIQDAFNHISKCVLCQGRGYVCQVCKKPEVIFPWQLNTVYRCPKCANCFHLACYSPKIDCTRCAQQTTRRKNSFMTAKNSRQ